MRQQRRLPSWIGGICLLCVAGCAVGVGTLEVDQSDSSKLSIPSTEIGYLFPTDGAGLVLQRELSAGLLQIRNAHSRDITIVDISPVTIGEDIEAWTPVRHMDGS